jgi:hypothetical protein
MVLKLLKGNIHDQNDALNDEMVMLMVGGMPIVQELALDSISPWGI